MSPVASVQMDEGGPVVPIRAHPVPFDDDEPPANLSLPDGTPEDTASRVSQLQYEIAWREQRIAEHEAAVRLQKAMLQTLKHDPSYRPYSRG